MANSITKPFWQALGLGTLAGLRSMSAPAVTSQILSHHHSKALEGSPLSFIQSEKVANALTLLALTELVADKLPSTPNRIKAPILATRCLSGALAGASIYKASGGNAYLGAVLGGSAAVLSSFGAFYLRKYTVKSTHLVDPIIGSIEDALVIGSGYTLAKTA
jgi:uncharacterized membrane protein